jgi:ribosomal protein S18 acetylase RimI-like enzyme
MNQIETKTEACDYMNPKHLQAVAGLINAYILDDMGGGKVLSEPEQFRLIDGLANHPRALVFFAVYEGVYAGLLVAFENFSTFNAQAMINIHDLIVLKEYRKKGIGRMLMNALIDEAGQRKCSRITLEVRKDNFVAQALYKQLGFDETDPEMFYWRKKL